MHLFKDGHGTEHVLLISDGGSVQLTVTGASITRSARLLTDLCPPDGLSKQRLAAIALFNALCRKRIAVGDRVTRRPSSRRLYVILEALDAHLSGATQKDIALQLFGQARVEAAWRHPGGYMRDYVRRAIRRGRHLMASGYRSLLQA